MTAPQLDDQVLATLLAQRASRAELADEDRDRLLAAVFATTAQPNPRWQWRSAHALLPLATVIVVIVVIGAAILGTAPLRLSGSSPSVSAQASLAGATAVVPTASPDAVAGLHILSADELRAAIDAAAADGLDHVVLAQANIDRAALANYSLGICRPQDPCPVGELSGIEGPRTLVLAGPEVRAGLSHTPPPDPITGILALAIHGRSSVELLGVVDPEPSGSLLRLATIPEVYSGTEAPLGHVIAVDGWLGATRVICPTTTPGLPGDSPFEECATDWLVSFEMASGGPPPSNAIRVQPDAFSEFAPLPGRDAPTAVTLRGTYLLRLVADPRTTCSGNCRGWRMVGRLPDSPSTAPEPSPSLGASPTASRAASPSGFRSLLYVELQQLLSEARADGQERVVMAFMEIDRRSSQFQDRADCGKAGGCLVGTMPDADGKNVPIYAASDERDSWGNNTAPVGGTFVVRVSSQSMDLLGFAQPTASGELVWPARASGLKNVPQDVLVDGWLTGTAFPCPTGPLDNGDSPFFYCDDGWITETPVSSDPNAQVDDGTFLALDGIPVQPSAYDAFAPDPVGGAITQPRHGTYLIRHVTTTYGGCNPCDAWRVLARMTEDGLPFAGISPVPTAPPLAESTILTADELRTAIADHRTGGAATSDVVADVSIDVTQRPQPEQRKCMDPVGQCIVIGTLQGFVADEGAVVLRNDDYYPDLTFRDGQGPVALRLSTGPVQYLGHVATGSSGLTWLVAEAQAQESSVTPGDVVAVKGWLEYVLPGCGPAPRPGPPINPPFGCASRDAITPTPVQTSFPFGGNGTQTVEPKDALLVQMGAFNQFADLQRGDDLWKYGVYLVERVQNLNSNCGNCQGWLVVGRLALASEGPTR
jgi:hypothetical protein